MSEIRPLTVFCQFLNNSKKYWLAPVIIVIFLIGFTLVLSKGSGLAPFIYSRF
jgi:hypothetical protein